MAETDDGGAVALSDAEQAQFDVLLDRALERQRAAIETALEQTVRHVPFPARRIVRKALFG